MLHWKRMQARELCWYNFAETGYLRNYVYTSDEAVTEHHA